MNWMIPEPGVLGCWLFTKGDGFKSIPPGWVTEDLSMHYYKAVLRSTGKKLGFQKERETKRWGRGKGERG